MSVSKKRYQYSFKQGNDAENKFKNLMETRGNTCVKSNRNDDIKKHIDFYVNQFSVDVKGNRHLQTVWLEIKNVKGDKGWLQGEADYIVFDLIELESFCFFKTKDLFDYVKNIKEIAADKNDYNKLYTRKDRKDVLVKVKYNDIKHLEKQRIRYEQKNKQP